MLESLFNPVVLGGAVGATVVLFAIGMLTTGFLKKLFDNGIASFFAYILAGVVATGLAAYGFADGGDPKWIRAAFSYGMPAGVAAIASIVVYSIFAKKNDKEESGALNLFVLVFLGISALFGQRFALIEEFYSEREYFFEDPVMDGFEAMERNYPTLWEEFKGRAKNADMIGGDIEAIGISFFQEHIGTFYQNGSDGAVFAMMDLGVEKLRHLSRTDQQMCLTFGMGEVPKGITSAFPLEIKMKEAETLKWLFDSKGRNSSGIAADDEAEEFLVTLYEDLAKTDPQGLSQVLLALQDVESNPASACYGLIRLQEMQMKDRNPALARMLRHPLNWDPNYPLSAEGERRIAIAAMKAEFSLAQSSLPVQLDASTKLVASSVDDTTVNYVYEVSDDLSDTTMFQSFFDEQILPNVCADQIIIEMLSLGLEIRYSYNGNDGTPQIMTVAQEDCR